MKFCKQSTKIDIKDSIQEVIEQSDIILIATPTPHEEGYDGREPTSEKQPKDFKVLLVYPNLTMMLVPSLAMALFTGILKKSQESLMCRAYTI